MAGPRDSSSSVTSLSSLHELSSGRLHYSRANRLGKGAFGDVYRGVLDEESAVAVKVLKGGNVIARRQFRRELRRYSRLSVNGVVSFYGAARAKGSKGNIDVLVTELMKGGSLRHCLDDLRERKQRMHQNSVLRIAEMVANGLAQIHGCGFSHGDLKPSNVLFSEPIQHDATSFPPRVRAKLVDFGLSRDLAKDSNSLNSDDEEEQTNSLPSAVPGSPNPIEPIGTPSYLAPEAWRGSAALSNPAIARAADVYALSILLYELDTGLLPWANHSEWAIFGAVYHSAERPTWPKDCEESVPGFRKIIEQCWAQNYLNRPTAEHVATALKNLRRSIALSSPTLSTSGSSLPNSPDFPPPSPLPDFSADILPKAVGTSSPRRQSAASDGSWKQRATNASLSANGSRTPTETEMSILEPPPDEGGSVTEAYHTKNFGEMPNQASGSQKPKLHSRTKNGQSEQERSNMSGAFDLNASLESSDLPDRPMATTAEKREARSPSSHLQNGSVEEHPLAKFLGPKPLIDDDDDDSHGVDLTTSQAFADFEENSNSTSRTVSEIKQRRINEPGSVHISLPLIHSPFDGNANPEPPPIVETVSFLSKRATEVSSAPEAPADLISSESSKEDEVQLSPRCRTPSIPSSAFAKARAQTPGNMRFVGRPSEARDISEVIDQLGRQGTEGSIHAPKPMHAPVNEERAKRLSKARSDVPVSVAKLDYPFKVEVKENNIAAVLAALRETKKDQERIIQILKALAILSGVSEDNRLAVVDGNALELLAMALSRYGRKNSALCRASCDFLFTLASGKASEVERELRLNGACEIVLNSMRWHPANVGVAQSASMALSALCRASPDMCSIVIAQDGLACIRRTLSRSASSFDGDVPVACAALQALSALAESQPAALAADGTLDDVLHACQIFSHETIDENAVLVLHSVAKTKGAQAGPTIAERGGVAVLAKVIERCRLSPHAGRTLIFACDTVSELATSPSPATCASLCGSTIAEAVLLAMAHVDSVEPFNVGTALAVRTLICVRKLTGVGLDMCGSLHLAHALEAVINVVNARSESIDVAVHAAKFVSSLIANLPSGPLEKETCKATLDMLKGLDELWLREVRVLETVRHAIEAVEKAQGGRDSPISPDETLQTRPVLGKVSDRVFSGRRLFGLRRR